MRWSINSRNTRVTAAHNDVRSDIAISTSVAENETVMLDKFVGVCSSLNHPADQLVTKAREKTLQAQTAGFDKMLRAHSEKWDNIWLHADIKIEGDVAAQQAIRFNIFQLNQTYTGDDERLNVGPKGFTGEKIRRHYLLGHRGLLHPLLPGHGPCPRYAQSFDISLQAPAEGHRKRRKAGLHQWRRPLPHGNHQRGRVSQRVGNYL